MEYLQIRSDVFCVSGTVLVPGGGEALGLIPVPWGTYRTQQIKQQAKYLCDSAMAG